ncbi:rCG46591, isoform CRA_b [Rattus norvegicus]|uniref:RCG46591, isoform CRA_b n=1 Tax=Rattus norvegicus TaxID=10116 RepID=A6IXU5_RAT|nr:rCG46591, isoform CRA_b [Rattus norvegicus]
MLADNCCGMAVLRAPKASCPGTSALRVGTVVRACGAVHQYGHQRAIYP